MPFSYRGLNFGRLGDDKGYHLNILGPDGSFDLRIGRLDRGFFRRVPKPNYRFARSDRYRKIVTIRLPLACAPTGFAAGLLRREHGQRVSAWLQRTEADLA